MNHWQRTVEARKATWDHISKLGVDILLVQEAVMPEGLDSIYSGAIGPTRPWGVGIVNLNPALSLKQIPTRPIGGGEGPDSAFHDSVLEVSQPGLIAAADVLGTKGEELLTVLSVYGLNADKALNGIRYTTTVVHRILSDVTPLIDTYRGKRRVVLAGDLNVSPQIEYPDTRTHEVVIDRIKAFGMVDCLGKFHDDYVQTHRARNSTKPWQDDWVFVSRHLEESLDSCEPMGNEETWALSDHCPVLLEVDVKPDEG